MRAAVWTRILITFPLWGLCLPAYSALYIVIMKTHGSEERLEEILSQPLLEQEWQQLTLSPLMQNEGKDVLDQLQALVPEVSFEPGKAIDNKRFFIAKNPVDNDALYLSWLVSHDTDQVESLNTIQTLSTRLLPDKPATAASRMPPAKAALRATDQSGQSILTVFKPQLTDIVSYNLYKKSVQHPHHFILTPLLSKRLSDNTDPDSLSERFLTLTLGAEAAGLISGASAKFLHHDKHQPPKPPKTTKLVAPIETPQHSSIIKSELKFLSPSELIVAGTQVRDYVKNWKATDLLHAGDFGTVRVYKSSSSSQKPLVVKKIRSSKGGYKFLSREVSYLHSLQHKNIIQFHGIAVENIKDKEQKLWVALEYFPDRDMSYQIKKNPALFTEENIKKIIRDTALAIAYLHKQDIVHRDLKPDNILLEVDNDIVENVKLTDFGFATSTSSDNILFCGSPLYAPPERLRDDMTPCLKKGDIWGVGVTLYVGLTKQKQPYWEYPYHLYDPKRFIAWRKMHPEEEIGEKKSLTKLQSVLSHLKPPQDNATHLIQQCCHANLQERPDIDKVLIHPFLTTTSSKASKQ